MSDIVTRFAPSPTGHLHLGHAHSALVGWHAARCAGGRFLLRIEDIDRSRCRPEFSAAIREDLAGTTAADPSSHGDVVLARKDTPTSYHLAVTVDDALQGVTLVTRGDDLFAATHVHRLLQALLGLPTPRYRHHPLITDASGRRFPKRDRPVTLHLLRARGRSPAETRAMAGFAEGSGPAVSR